MKQGLLAYLGIPEHVSIYLGNGAFYTLGKCEEVPRQEYEDFVRRARPDWDTIPEDYIPTPHMDDAQQLKCLRRTMDVNRVYRHDGYVPVVHISRHLDEYLRQFKADKRLRSKPAVALGGIVPNLLRSAAYGGSVTAPRIICGRHCRKRSRSKHTWPLALTRDGTRGMWITRSTDR